LEGRVGNLARLARPIPGLHRDSQSLSGLLFGEDLQLRRHDYNVNVAGGFRAAQLTSDYSSSNGIRFPTKRRAHTCTPDRQPIMEMLMVSIDISDVKYT
jgi:hypothetical protein